MQQFEFNGSVITTRISEDGRLYFRANDVVTALGYKSKQKPILKFVSPEYVTTFGEMRANQFDKFERLHTKYSKRGSRTIVDQRKSGA